MSLSETMTELMDAARVKFPLVNKLSILDLKQLLLSRVVSSETIQMSGATADGKWQKIPLDSSQNQYQIYPFGNLGYVSAKRGDTIFQAVTLKTDGIFQETLISFYQRDFGHHNVTAETKKMNDGSIRISAYYTCDSDGDYLLQDINGLLITNGTYVEIGDCYAAISPVGGGIKHLLNALVPSIGGACYAA